MAPLTRQIPVSALELMLANCFGFAKLHACFGLDSQICEARFVRPDL